MIVSFLTTVGLITAANDPGELEDLHQFAPNTPAAATGKNGKPKESIRRMVSFHTRTLGQANGGVLGYDGAHFDG